MANQNGLAGWNVLQHGNRFMGKLAALLAGLFCFFPVSVYPGLFPFLVIVHRLTALLASRRGGMAKPFRGLIWGARLHFQSNRFISGCAQQDFRLMEFLLVGIVDALALVKNTTTRSIAKTKLIERLEGRYISQINLPASKTSPAMKKLEYRQEWLDGKIPDNIPEIQYSRNTILC